MSDKPTESTFEPTEIVKQALLHRFSGAFTAYLITSWLAVNWSNIYILFMSKIPAEERLSRIYNQDWFMTRYLLFPIFLGFILSIATPIVNALVVNFTAYFLARSERNQEIARARVGRDIAKIEASKFGYESRIQYITQLKEELELKVNALNEMAEKLSEKIKLNYNDILRILLRKDEISREVKELLDKDVLTHEEWLERVNDIFTPVEISGAKSMKEHLREKFGDEIMEAIYSRPQGSLEIDPQILDELVIIHNLNVKFDKASNDENLA